MRFNNCKKICPNCHKEYDDCLPCCPKCHADNLTLNPIVGQSKALFMPWPRQLAMFLIGSLGLTFISTVVSLIAGLIYKDNPAYLGSMEMNMILNSICYASIFLSMIAIVFPFAQQLVTRFLKFKTWVYGILGGVALIVFGILYSFLVSLGYQTSGNNNQANIENLVVIYPAFAIIIFGIIGPMVEEFTYRIGCFTLCARVNKILAYVVTSIIFGLIHFDFTVASQEALINELINIPIYIVSGVILCFIYERSSWAGSSIAHIINNMYATISILITSHMA